MSLKCIYFNIIVGDIPVDVFFMISVDTFLKSFFEWEAVQYEVDSICKEELFTCPACSPDTLAVSVDGNRKHYRFRNAARYYKIYIISQCLNS